MIAQCLEIALLILWLNFWGENSEEVCAFGVCSSLQSLHECVTITCELWKVIS